MYLSFTRWSSIWNTRDFSNSDLKRSDHRQQKGSLTDNSDGVALRIG
jgi:hypothetical protein